MASEQLSHQPHYHFGMRSIAITLVMAAAIKRKEPNTDEDLIVIRALRESTIPKLIGEDINLFSSILLDLFPDIDSTTPDEGDIKQSILTVIQRMGLQPIPSLITKCLQLYQVGLIFQFIDCVLIKFKDN
jgi:dynein heavy chain